jgi:hypothetical protein
VSEEGERRDQAGKIGKGSHGKQVFVVTVKKTRDATFGIA